MEQDTCPEFHTHDFTNWFYLLIQNHAFLLSHCALITLALLRSPLFLICHSLGLAAGTSRNSFLSICKHVLIHELQ